MATVEVPISLTVEHLMAAVKQFSPDEFREFKQRLAAWEAQQTTPQHHEEAALIRATQRRLPVADQQRLKRLIAKSERGTLTPKEVDAYRTLAQHVEQLNVTRTAALAALVQRRGQPVQAVMQDIAWEHSENGT